jgi:hypothetical protein
VCDKCLYGICMWHLIIDSHAHAFSEAGEPMQRCLSVPCLHHSRVS